MLICYLLVVMPMEKWYMNYIELLNECTFIICHYCLLLFTDYVGDMQTQYDMGKVFMWVVISNICINILIIVTVIGASIIMWIKTKCKKKRKETHKHQTIRMLPESSFT
jgi:hypothetical protein